MSVENPAADVSSIDVANANDNSKAESEKEAGDTGKSDKVKGSFMCTKYFVFEFICKSKLKGFRIYNYLYR